MSNIRRLCPLTFAVISTILLAGVLPERGISEPESEFPNEPLTSRSVVGSEAAQGTGNVELVAHLGGATSGIAAEGNYVYLGTASRLLVLDATDPSSPRVVSE